MQEKNLPMAPEVPESNFKFYSKLVLKSTFAWLRVFLPALLFSCGVFVLSMVLLFQQEGAGFSGAGHAGALGAVMGILVLFIQFPCTMSSLVFSASIFPFLYFNLANKYAIHFYVFETLKHKALSKLLGKLESRLDSIEKAQPEWFQDYSKATLIKMRLLQLNKEDKEIKRIEKIALQYILKKLDFSELQSMEESDLCLSRLLMVKMETVLLEFGEPSQRLVLLSLVFQGVLLVGAFLYK